MSLRDPNVVRPGERRRVAIVIANPAISSTAGFANVEEDFADHAVWNYGLLARDQHVMPWRIEDELKQLGANYVRSGLWRSFAVRDGNLITGQQKFSAAETARLVIEALGR